MHRIAAAFFWCLAAPVFGADAPVLHPKGSGLPFAHQGPFVSTADGGVLCVDSKNALRSLDEGRTWKSTPLFPIDPAKYTVSNERALLRTREGVIVSAWMNLAERSQPDGWPWGVKGADWRSFVLPTYISRSTDDGLTWETPQKLAEPWCGCIHSLIQMKNGRLVLIGQEIIPEWRHATVAFVSDDLGKTWQRSDLIDYGVGAHDHAGSIEGTVVERADGSLYLLLRTESGYLWEASSENGLRWTGLQKTTIPSVTCCAQMARLADGRVALLWNAPVRHNPTNKTSRAELSLAFSNDDARTWSEPVIVAANYQAAGRVSYPYLYERSPGVFWITTMQGGLRMQIAAADLGAGEIPKFVPPPKVEPKPGGIVMFGDSTTAPRGGVENVYAQRVETALQGIGSSLGVHNAGVGGNSTRDARRRFANDVLRHQPRVVVMQFGLNDSAVDVWKNPPATAPRVPVEEYVENYRHLISESQKAGARVIVMTTNPTRWTSKLRELYGKPPYDPDAEDGFEKPYLNAYNEALRRLATELKIPLIDVYAEYPGYAKKLGKPVDALLLDGMHPGDAGHELVAELLVPAIREAVR
jgi:sialidase-1